MRHRAMLTAMGIALAAGGCTAAPSPDQLLAVERSAHLVLPMEEEGDSPWPIVPVEHVFDLRNRGTVPVTIISHRTRIDTVWHFEDTGDARLPREIAPGEHVRVSVTAKVRRPEPIAHYVELLLSNGEAVRLDLYVKWGA